MTARVLIQAGHSASFPPFQQGGGGAPGEAAWTATLAQRLAARLSTRGVDVTIVGCWLLDNSNPPPAVADTYELFLALHYDADIYPERSGCFAGRATNDPCGVDADRFIALWREGYPAATGIPLHEERLNPNVLDYYAFRVTSDQTPGVLIEHGVGMGLDHAALYDGIETVADADTAAILAYLGGDDMTTPAQRQMLDMLAGRQITTPQALQDVFTWGDQTAIDVEALRQEVAALKAAQQPAPTVTTVEVRFSDGSAVEVPTTP